MIKTDSSPKEQMSDEDLTLLAKNGDTDAFTELVARYLPVISYKAYGYKGDCEDLKQEGLISLIIAVRRFDVSRQVSFKTFASHCISNRISTAVKAIKNNKICIDDSIEYCADNIALSDKTDPVSLVISRENMVELNSRMSSLLSIFEQAALKLYLSGHTYHEMALVLNSSTKAVDNALQRVRRKLRSVV